jgi:hypothetical protein
MGGAILGLASMAACSGALCPLRKKSMRRQL